MSPRQRSISTLNSDDDETPQDTTTSSIAPAPVKPSVTLTSTTEEEISASSPLLSKSSPNTPLGPLGNNVTVVDIRERDRHDIFNLFALPLLLVAAVANWDIPMWIRERTSLQESWHDSHIYELIATIMIYFIVDLLWVSFVPSCVKSPGTIIKHHIVALIYNCAPIWYPEYRCFMGVILTVELNTWFLIMRRVLYLRKDSSPYVTPKLRVFVDYAFYISWIVIRVVGYNAILSSLIPLFILRIRLKQTVLFPTLFVSTQVLLNLMNLKWTYDLFTPILQRYYYLRTTTNKKSYGNVNDDNRHHTL